MQNVLLSFLYSLLTHDCRSALESCGLDSQCGFLHRDQPGRPSLFVLLSPPHEGAQIETISHFAC